MPPQDPTVPSLLIGTAGHVDHGKTALVRALTGIDCDRLAEEKRRGITLDLGFAHLATGEALLGFVDVPGHERFLGNALAGLGGVRLLLLVVAADEGVKAQTREHLAVASLLGIPRLVVALSKIDAVADDTREIAELEVRELLAATPYADSLVLPVSAFTGEGVARLGETLAREARTAAVRWRDAEPVRLPIDRAFHLKGQGVIVTGTLVSGMARAGDELELLPARARVRCRAVEVHGDRRDARSGERAAIQLAGVELDDLHRGMELASPGAFHLTRRLVVELTLLKESPQALERSSPMRFHLYAREVLGRPRPLAPARLAPGETGVVEMTLAEPIVAVRGDRFIARRLSPEALLGGGRVLDPFPRRGRAIGRTDPQAVELRGGDAEVLVAWCAAAGARGLSPAEAAARLGRFATDLERELQALAAHGRLVELGSGGQLERLRFLAPETLAAVRAHARAELARYFREQPLQRGLAKAEAAHRLLPGGARARAELFFDLLVRLGEVEIVDGEIRQPGRSIATPAELSPLAQAILNRFVAAGITPASPAELTRDLAPKREIMEGLVRHLVTRGDLTRLSSGLVLATSALATLARELRATNWDRFSVPQFKARFALSRKWAIPLLEHLDDVRVTQRIGDERRVLATRESPTR